MSKESGNLLHTGTYNFKCSKCFKGKENGSTRPFSCYPELPHSSFLYLRAFDVTVWGNGQTLSHSNGLRAPEGASAHPAALGQCYSINHMKRTLVTLLPITHVPLLLALPHSLPFYFFFAHTYWHIVIRSQSEWWPQRMKYRLFSTISTGQTGTQLKSWTHWVSIIRRDETKAP